MDKRERTDRAEKEQITAREFSKLYGMTMRELADQLGVPVGWIQRRTEGINSYPISNDENSRKAITRLYRLDWETFQEDLKTAEIRHMKRTEVIEKIILSNGLKNSEENCGMT